MRSARIAAATLLLAAAAWLAFPKIRPMFTVQHSITVPPEHQAIAAEVRRMMAGHPQRGQVAAFYAAMADLVPRLPENATGHQARRWFETAAKLQFGDTFQRVPGLAEAIHGPNGIIAKIYGTEAGPLDRAKMKAALLAVAWACSD